MGDRDESLETIHAFVSDLTEYIKGAKGDMTAVYASKARELIMLIEGLTGLQLLEARALLKSLKPLKFSSEDTLEISAKINDAVTATTESNKDKNRPQQHCPSFWNYLSQTHLGCDRKVFLNTRHRNCRYSSERLGYGVCIRETQRADVCTLVRAWAEM